jgi:hypothetical protein
VIVAAPPPSLENVTVLPWSDAASTTLSPPVLARTCGTIVPENVRIPGNSASWSENCAT